MGKVVEAAAAFGNLPAGVADVVAQAIVLRGTEPDRAEVLMWRAQAEDPSSLEMYVGLASSTSMPPASNRTGSPSIWVMARRRVRGGFLAVGRM